MKAGGVDPAEIKWVIISHLHFDHAGLIDAFPRAMVLVDKREWLSQKEKLARKPDSREVSPAALEGHINLRLVDLSLVPAFGAFEHAADLFNDGTIYLLDLAGHTPGNMGAWINMDEGPVLLTGDASWVIDNYRDLALPIRSNIFDLAQYTRRLYMIHGMARAISGLVVFPGHDLSALKSISRQDVKPVSFLPR